MHEASARVLIVAVLVAKHAALRARKPTMRAALAIADHAQPVNRFHEALDFVERIGLTDL